MKTQHEGDKGLKVHKGESEGIPPRPYRKLEVFTDLVPVIIILPYLIVRMGGMPPNWISAASAFMVAAFVLPIAGAAWMQFLTSTTLGRICQKERRESLALTEIKTRPYLISVLKPRVTVQAFPFALGLAFCILASFLGVGSLIAYSEQMDKFPLGIGMIYALASMQFCGLCAGLLGLLGRLRSLCKPKGSDQYLFLISLKWLFIVLITPVLAVVGGIYVELTSISDSNGREFFGPSLALYLLASCSILNLIFYYSLTTSWLKAQAAYFTFE